MSINYQNYYILKLLTQKMWLFTALPWSWIEKNHFLFYFQGCIFWPKMLIYSPPPRIANALFLPCFFAMCDRFKFANYMVYARSATNFALFKPFHKKLALFCQKQGRNKEKLMVFLFLKHNFPLFWLFFRVVGNFFARSAIWLPLFLPCFSKMPIYSPGPKYTPLGSYKWIKKA